MAERAEPRWRLPAVALTGLLIAAPAPAGESAFVPDASCASCHREAFDAWRGSHHDQAMQPATPETVLGDFEDAKFVAHGVTTRFFRRDGAFLVDAEGPDGIHRDYRVRYTFGVDPLQQYLVEAPGGRLQALTVAWDVERRRWYSLYPHVRIAPDDALHWTGVYQNWNAMCAECHSTNLREGYDLSADAFSTTWSEPDVGCQACHGPGAAHVDWAERRAGDDPSPHEIGLVVDFARGDGRYQVEQCARCHARRERASTDDAHGRAFMDDFVPATLRADLYHADGQIDAEVYVWGSFVQSRMYAAGVRCTDCHDAHSLRLVADGNGLCTRCHQSQPDPRFPELAARAYDSPEHHFHQEGSDGARCVGCHMPGKVYMGIDHRRDHGFRVPRPDVSARVGAPDVCTGCHADRDLAWAEAELRARFGEPAPTPHRAEAIAAGRRREPGAGPALAAIAEDRTQPAIVRATALELLGGYGAVGGKALAQGLSDEDPLVRLGALHGLEPLPPRVRLAGAAGRVDDPVRAVRIEAARLLAPFPAGSVSPELGAALERAERERLEALTARAALPAGRLGLALEAETQGDIVTAEQHYRNALALDPRFAPARFNLATLLNRANRNDDAERLLRDGLALTPDEGEMHYSLGLLLAEEERYAESAQALARAAELLPERYRVQLNLGLALARAGRSTASGTALRRALALAPSDPRVLQALAHHHMDRREWEAASEYAGRWLRVARDPARPRALLRQLEVLRRYGSSG